VAAGRGVERRGVLVVLGGGRGRGGARGVVVLFEQQVVRAAQLCGQSLVVHLVLHILHLLEFRVHRRWQDAVVLLFGVPAAAPSLFPFFPIL